MQYMGGKVRIAKYLVPVLQERLKDKDTFVDLFCGSCNIISAIKAPNRIANDLHKELIALHKAVQSGWVPPSVVTEEDYKQSRLKSISRLLLVLGVVSVVNTLVGMQEEMETEITL